MNGHAIAGGCVLDCCADKRIAAKDGGRIGVTELLVGVPFPPMAMEVMRFDRRRSFSAGDPERRDIPDRRGAGRRSITSSSSPRR